MNKTRKSRNGFTLVELMVATLAFSILVLAVGSMLVFGWMGWKRNNDLVNMQRDASLAMMMISKEIRNASYDEIIEGSGISFTGSGISFAESGNDIVHSGGMTVVDGWLDTGSFRSRKVEFSGSPAGFKTNQWVEVAFTLATATETESYLIKVSPRNGL